MVVGSNGPIPTIMTQRQGLKRVCERLGEVAKGLDEIAKQCEILRLKTERLAAYLENIISDRVQPDLQPRTAPRQRSRAGARRRPQARIEEERIADDQGMLLDPETVQSIAEVRRKTILTDIPTPCFRILPCSNLIADFESNELQVAGPYW